MNNISSNKNNIKRRTRMITGTRKIKNNYINAQEKMQKSSGITLISLVVTVIIIMILAGVSISMLTGQNRNNNTSNRSII